MSAIVEDELKLLAEDGFCGHSTVPQRAALLWRLLDARFPGTVFDPAGGGNIFKYDSMGVLRL